MIVDVLKEACRQVYRNTRGMAGTGRGSMEMGRGAGGDMSRRIDLVAEKAAISVFRKRGVDATIIGEECGRIEGKKGFIVMDAVDGTTNAVRGVPFYCCSLAYTTDFKLSTVVHAAVIDLATGDLYHASENRGAFLNGRKIAVRRSSKDAVIGINISGIRPDVVSRLSPVMSKANHVRQFGANALELCYMARGLLDAYIDFRDKIRPTDIAGAYLVVKEAGGRFYSDKGSGLDSDLDVKTRLSFLAATDEMFKELAGDLFPEK